MNSNSFLSVRAVLVFSFVLFSSLLLAVWSTTPVKLGATATGKCIISPQRVETSTKYEVRKVEHFQSFLGPLQIQMLWLTS